MNFDEPVYTSEEVAKRYQTTTRTINRWVRKGYLSALNIGGRRIIYRFRLADLIELEAAMATGKLVLK